MHAPGACARCSPRTAREFPADLVIVGVGVVPADELARAAGLDCENGVVTDAHCRTSDEAIYAAGDCASHLNRQYGRHLRLESVDNAFEQGTTVALNLLGTPTPHDKVPWFWSDQFDLKLDHRGRRAMGYDTVVHAGRPAQPQLQRLLPARRGTGRHRQHQRPQGPDGRAQADRRARAAGSGQARRSQRSR